jgi:hypothetical protein
MNQVTSIDAFDKFTAAFDQRLRQELLRRQLTPGESIDGNIALLAQINTGILKAALESALVATIGKPIPEDRVGDRVYAYGIFVLVHHRTPNDQPMLNDVLYKIKTTDELMDPLRVFVSDKEFVKIYIKATVGDEYNVPTIDVLRDRETIDTYDFPSSCAIKATHGSGQVIIRKNGEIVDRELIKDWLGINLYRRAREINYKTLKPKVIVEPLIWGQSDVPDFKFFCLDGAVKLIVVIVHEEGKRRSLCFDKEWNEHPFTINQPKAAGTVGRPHNLKQMIATAERLSRNFGLVRIDLYSDGTRHLAGEITNCNWGANARVYPASAEKTVSDIIFS